MLAEFMRVPNHFHIATCNLQGTVRLSWRHLGELRSLVYYRTLSFPNCPFASGVLLVANCLLLTSLGLPKRRRKKFPHP